MGSEMCIRDSTGIRKASQRLNYNNSIPSVAFPCSKHEATDLHPAIISRSGLLTCTAQPASVCNKLTESHKLWFGKNMLSGSASKGKCTEVSSDSVLCLLSIDMNGTNVLYIDMNDNF